MVVKEKKNSFESSMFYKTNMKINRNLPKVYAFTLLLAVAICCVGLN
ncbi:hypothetical protein [Halarcobacter ebronensis]|nr:hypothetical protein [Halarcobacter ebronensis]